jgi:hypothetical protein
MSERPGSPVRRLVPLLLAAALLAKSAAPPPRGLPEKYNGPDSFPAIRP